MKNLIQNVPFPQHRVGINFRVKAVRRTPDPWKGNPNVPQWCSLSFHPDYHYLKYIVGLEQREQRH